MDSSQGGSPVQQDSQVCVCVYSHTLTRHFSLLTVKYKNGTILIFLMLSSFLLFFIISYSMSVCHLFLVWNSGLASGLRI